MFWNISLFTKMGRWFLVAKPGKYNAKLGGPEVKSGRVNAKVHSLKQSENVVLQAMMYSNFYRPQGKVTFSQTSVSHFVHNWPYGYLATARSCYGAISTHPTGMLSCTKCSYLHRSTLHLWRLLLGGDTLRGFVERCPLLQLLTTGGHFFCLSTGVVVWLGLPDKVRAVCTV